MNDKGAKSPQTLQNKYRKHAEARAREEAAQMKAAPAAPSPEATLRLLHELQVHQIELEMQNEELSRARAELEVSNARYFDLYDMAPVGYFTLGESGKILEANLTAAGLLGVARSALVRSTLAKFILPEDQHIFSERLKQLFAAGPSQTFRLRMLRADAAPFWARLEASAALDAAGAHVCRTVMSDITEIRSAEQERARTEAHLAKLQKAESLGLMAGAIAHHFNNLLQAVMGNLELAMRDLPAQNKPVEHLIEAMRAARRASEVSSLMLTYVGEVVGKPEQLDLSVACRSSLPMLRAAMLKDLVLETDLPSPGPIVRASANQIQQVLTNLIANAWEAIGEGRGAIRLATRTVPAAEIPTEHRFPGDWKPLDHAYASIEVSEKGRGITLENIEKIFDPFFSDKFTRRGLGLSAVLGIVRAHGGAVAVESEPGKGSSFRVFLPLSAPEATLPAVKIPEVEPGGTVLLVENEEMVRRVTDGLLMSLGFSVFQAHDGVEAVELFRKHREKIRLVLCEATMPRMNGWETLAALRKLAPRIPVILVSGYDKAQVMAGDHPEMPQVFLRKPFRTEDLKDAIRDALAPGRGA